MHKPSVAAVIVTFNRSKKLSNVLDALEKQTQEIDAIYVVDNASTDDTAELMKSRADERIIHVRLPENIGGAGGFHEGMKVAYANGHDLFWISDDDAYPEPTAVEELVTQLTTFEGDTGWRPSFACSHVKWVDGTLCEMNVPQPVWDWPRWYTQSRSVALVGSCSFVSVLVPRWAVQEHGLPIKDYFIWHDDVEYTMRIARSYPGLFCPDSIVVHDTPENKGVNFSLVTEQSVWKYKYGVRNEVSRRYRDSGIMGVAAFAYHVRSQMRGGGVPSRLRRSVYKALISGLSFKPKVCNADGTDRG